MDMLFWLDTVLWGLFLLTIVALIWAIWSVGDYLDDIEDRLRNLERQSIGDGK